MKLLLKTLRAGALAVATLISLSAHAAPTVTLTAPGNGWSYNVPAALTLRATAATDPADVGATLTRVEFYLDGQLLGSDATSSYSLAWSATILGSHVLSAKAIDSLGQQTTSAPVTLILTDATTNSPPTVSLTAPANNAKYALPADITLTASAADIEKNGHISQVDFLANGQIVGTRTASPFSLVWSNPPAGTYSLIARATDNLGATTDSAARTLTVQNNTPPTVTLGGAAAGTYVLPATLNFTAAAAGSEVNTPVTLLEFLANGQVIASLTAPPYAFAWIDPAPGSYTVAARATDSQGLVTTSTPRSITINASNTPPTVSLTAPANNSTYVLPADVIVSANATDLEKNGGITQVQFYANGQAIGTVTTKPYSLTWSNPLPGSYTLTALATDTAGAQTTSLARTVTLSDTNAPPKVSLTAPANKAVFVSPASVTLTANATGPEANTPIALVEFLVDGQVVATTTTKPYSATWTNPALGSHNLSVRATDSLGAVTTSAIRTVTINANQAPTVVLTSPTPNQILPAPATLTLAATATDSDGTIAKVEFYQGTTLIGTATAAPYTTTWSNVPSGSYSLTAIATDNLGAQTTSAAVPVTVNALPTVSLATAGAPYIAPASTTLTATAADSDGTITKVEFFNGATLIATATAAPYTASLVNLAPGRYSLTAKATDNLGGSTVSAAVLINVAANQAPTVSLTSPASGAVIAAPGTLTLSANAADADGTIAKVEFYQGTTLIGTATAVPYTVTWNNVPAGSYSLTAIATDNLGAQTTSAAVPVTVNALPTVTLTSPTVNQIVAAPATMTLSANATDSDGTIAKVEFYQSTTLIGTATAAPYTATWSNVPAGSYSLTAKATDNLGASTSSAPVAITVNAPPTVSLTAPTSGTVLIGPLSVTLSAMANDTDGSITQVAFLQNGTPIGTVTMAPYSLTWNAAPGSYQLTVIATDNLGTSTTSAPVTLTIVANQAPSVTLTSPTQNQSFKAPATVSLSAEATDPDGNLAKVEFYSGGTLIGSAFAAPYTATWSNVSQGGYQITAIATDAFGAQTTSAPTSITVTPAQASVFYIHPDHLGTPRLVTDETNNVVWRNLPTTEPFGNGTVEEDPNNTGKPFTLNLRHSGYYADRETGTWYAYFRDAYDPRVGGFPQSDPIGLAGGSLSTYAFVNGDPLSRIDSLGLYDVRDRNADRAAGLTPGDAMEGFNVNNSCVHNQLENNYPFSVDKIVRLFSVFSLDPRSGARDEYVESLEHAAVYKGGATVAGAGLAAALEAAGAPAAAAWVRTALSAVVKGIGGFATIVVAPVATVAHGVAAKNCSCPRE